MGRPSIYPNNTVSVRPATGNTSVLVRLWPDVVNTLKEYPREELMFSTLEGDEDEDPDKIMIAVIPFSDKRAGKPMRYDRGYSVIVARLTDIPIGHYSFNPKAENIDGIDWFELIPLKEN